MDIRKFKKNEKDTITQRRMWPLRLLEMMLIHNMHQNYTICLLLQLVPLSTSGETKVCGEKNNSVGEETDVYSDFDIGLYCGKEKSKVTDEHKYKLLNNRTEKI